MSTRRAGRCRDHPAAVPLAAAASATAPAAGAIPYTSSALGISFSYLSEQNGQTVKVLEQGDKIYFLSIGRYAILAGDDQAWQETISFK